MNKPKETEQHIGLIFQHIARQRTKLYDQTLAPHGLTSAQVFVINHLLDTDGLTQVELANLAGIGTVAMSGLIDRLEAHEWVVRRADPRDRRSKQIWLMPVVESKKGELFKAAEEINKISMATLSPDEVDLFLSIMRRIRANLTEALR